jgi:hypothetical protein
MSNEIPAEAPIPIEEDVGYWRKMYEELLAVQEEGFTALLADRDEARALLAEKDVKIARTRAEADKLVEALASVITEYGASGPHLVGFIEATLAAYRQSPERER